jgi:ribosome biogenesis GTPase A
MPSEDTPTADTIAELAQPGPGRVALQAPINWYPGHMAKSMRKLGERLSIVDAVIEVLDARLPRASSNPYLDLVAGKKPRIVVLCCEDLADPHATREWLAWYERRGRTALAVNGREQSSVKKLLPALSSLVTGSGTTRAMVVGIPNTGKSSIINGIARRTATRTEDKAGVTRALQWIRVQPKLEVMDTPGILVPKIATPEAQWQLALTGALPRERFDGEAVVAKFVGWAHAHRPGLAVPELEAFARARGFARRGGEVDLHNAAGAFLKDFGDAKFGRISFERPEPA